MTPSSAVTAASADPMGFTHVPRPPDWSRPRLGELLVRKGYLTADQVEWALQKAREEKELLGVVLLRERLMFDNDLARTLSEQLDVPYIDIMQVGVDHAAVRLLDPEVGLQAVALPIRLQQDGTVQVGFGDPLDQEAVAMVTERLPRIAVAVCEVSAITRTWRRLAPDAVARR